MKTLSSITLFVALINLNSFAQQGLQANLGSINRSTPKIGFNTNGHMPANFPTNQGIVGANWSQQSFIDTTVTLNPGILRFPGGTNANHWDWQTGWYLPAYQPPFPALTIRPEEFQVGLNAMQNCEGLFVMNLETSTISHEMDGLRHMNSLGLNTQLIELGNEHNLSNSSLPLQFMTSLGYAQLAKSFYDSIKLINPNSKVCVVGSNTGQRPDWHTQILAQNPNIEAFAWHAYTNANNIDLVFNVNRAFAVAFGDVNYPQSMANRYSVGGFDLLPSDKEVWVTEYNLWETQQTTAPVIAGTWTHALYLTALHDFFLKQNNVTMFLNHSLASIDPWHESISRQDQHVTANGVAMKLLLDISNGSQSCQNIVFNNLPTITYGQTTFPKLVGWKFNFNSTEKGFVCNFSQDTFKISLASVFSNAMDYVSFSADTNFVINGISSLNQFSNSSVDSIVILPFSFVQITSNPSSANLLEKTFGDLILFPNPANDILNFSKNLKEFSITNNLGQEIIKGSGNSISTESLKNGIYFLKTENSCLRFNIGD